MTHSLHFRGLLALAALTSVSLANAANEAFFFDEIGEVMGVSDNGQYVAMTDVDNHIGYIWHAEDPENIENVTIDNIDEGLPTGQTIIGVSVMDLTDDGMAVGAIYYKDGKQVPSYYLDGEWHQLPLHEEARFQNEAVAVTADGSIIAGYQWINDPTSEIRGKYYPCQWERNAQGEYDMHCYTYLDLPANQGFYVMTQNMDGTILAGMLFTDAGGTIPVMLKNGELVTFNKLETRNEPFYYNDKLLGYFDEYYVDGFHEGVTEDAWFQGAFDNCDAYGNFYGLRTRAENVTPEGDGNLVTGACIYNVDTDIWIDSTKDFMYTAGIGTTILFNGDASVILDGKAKSLGEAFDISTNKKRIAGVSKISIEGQVLGGMWYEIHPATGEPIYYPFVIMLEKPLSPGSDAEIVAGEDLTLFLITPGRIEVVNGPDAEVYTLDGRLAGRGQAVDVAPGTYAVKAGSTSRTVIVK